MRMNKVFQRPAALSDVTTHYCPGCTYGIAHRMIAEALDELGLTGRAVGIASVGCTVLAYDYLECDFMQAAHGRAPAVATGAVLAAISTDASDIGVTLFSALTRQGLGDVAEVLHGWAVPA